MYNSKVGPEARVDVTHLPWVSHFVCAGATPRKCIRIRTLVLACVMSCTKSLLMTILICFKLLSISSTLRISGFNDRAHLKMALSQCFEFYLISIKLEVNLTKHES